LGNKGGFLMTETKLSLEEIVFEFDLWRSKKQSRNEKVPDELMSLISHIKDEYPLTDIAKNLKLGYHKIKSYLDEIENNSIQKNDNISYFKKVIPESIINDSLYNKVDTKMDRKIIVNIKMPNGYEITIFQPE
jgi:hypothetical protein